MNAAALAGLCTLLSHGALPASAPAGVTCPAAANHRVAPDPRILRVQVGSEGARDAIARVTYAEAGDQGDSGLAAVVYTILNRLQDGRWGMSVDAVLNAHAQFEPVLRAGGDWRRLQHRSAAEQARIDTILNLALDGRLPDLTRGARFFQNPTLVASRAHVGAVAEDMVDFGGAAPSAQIGAHRFYVEATKGRAGGLRRAWATRGASNASELTLFVGAPDVSSPAPDRGGVPQSEPSLGDPSQALFVGSNGLVSATRP